MSLGSPYRAKHLAWLLVLLFLVPEAPSPAGPSPMPPLAGPDRPRPPQQGQPWTQPVTGLPGFLISATTALTEQGLPDPRGCEYREVDLVGEDKLYRNPASPRPRTHAWVLPPSAEGAPRYAIAWNGLIYPLTAIGEPANLDADVPPLPGAVPPGLPKEKRGYYRLGAVPHLQTALQDGTEPIRACLLLRLGRADLAERAFASATSWRPPGMKRDLTSYGVSYLTIASDWTWAMFERATEAHASRNDPQALADARELARIRPLIEAKSAAMGFADRLEANMGTGHLDFLKPLAALLADQERRALRGRGAAPSVADLEKIADQPARIAALIDSLDEYGYGGESAMFHSFQRAGVITPIVRQGHAALEPLIASLESDQRLTRSVSGDERHGTRMRSIVPTFTLTYSALTQIFGTNQFANPGKSLGQDADLAARKAVAGEIRAYVEQFRGVSEEERWYRILADDRASVSQWLVAGARLTA